MTRPANRVPSPQERRLLRVLLTSAPLTTATLGRAFPFSAEHTATLASTLFRTRLVRRVPAPNLQAHRSRGRALHALVPAPIATLLLYRRPTLLRPHAHLIALSELVDGTFSDGGALMLNRTYRAPCALPGAA